MSSAYLIALGSNRRHWLYGRPHGVLSAAMEEMAVLGTVVARSPIISSKPIGPAQRHFANAACVVESEYAPDALLAGLKRVEGEFGRRSGQHWGDRVLDLDIILWSCGIWASGGAHRFRLEIPHYAYRDRSFVLGPAHTIAPDWRDPMTGLTIAHSNARLTKPRRLPR